MKNVLMIALLILMLGSCKKSSTNTVSTKDTSGIVGNWKWIETYYGMMPSDSNPMTSQNAGYQELFSFNADSSYRLTKNNIIIDSGTYTHGHIEYTINPNIKLVYDSILYFHKGILIKGGVDYYKIYSDTLSVAPGLIRRLMPSYTAPSGGSVYWKKQ